jgi:hypothetical protein
MYQVLLRSNLAFTIVLLFSSKLLHYLLDELKFIITKGGLCQFCHALSSREIFFCLVWFLMEGARCIPFWFSLVIYVLWLIEMPWFWGRATSENGEIAATG